MEFFDYNTRIVLIGTSLLGALSGVVGSFAVLRRRALTGDAVAHAALPGLCMAFLIIGHRSLPAMLFGAFVSGVVGVMVISALRRTTRIKEDAALGIVLSVFYGAGIVLSSWIQRTTTAGSKAGLESYILGKTAGMLRQDVYLFGGIAFCCLTLLVLLYKEFKVISFDPGFAGVQGLPVLGLDLLLMNMVTLTVVIGLPAVGVVMIAALLIIPAAAARFWTEKLEVMLGLAGGMGLLTGCLGTILSARLSLLPAGPLIVIVATIFFLISMLFAPHRGILGRLVERRRFHEKISNQRVLMALYESMEGREDSAQQFSSRELRERLHLSDSEFRRVHARLHAAGWIREVDSNAFHLTDTGNHRAAEIARGQRLWRLFMSDHAELASSFADLDADRIDEVLPRDMVEALEEKLRKMHQLPPAGASA